MDQAIIGKIQRLLNLGQSSNEAEAALAMARAQELLAKYNLDWATVNDTPPDEKREKVKVDRSAKFKWQRHLWRTLAETNFCWYWVLDVSVNEASWRDRGKRHSLLGRLSNVTAVRLMGEYLEDTMQRQCPYPHTTRASTSWKEGCVDRLCERLREKYDTLQSMKSQGNDGPGIVLLKDLRQREYEANYDALHGQGAWNRKLIREKEWEEAQKKRQEEAARAAEEAERKWLEYLKNETPEQKAEREELEEKERLRELRRQRKYSYRSYSYRSSFKDEHANRNHKAYSAGASAGSNISLDSQINSPSAPVGHLE